MQSNPNEMSHEIEGTLDQPSIGALPSVGTINGNTENLHEIDYVVNDNHNHVLTDSSIGDDSLDYQFEDDRQRTKLTLVAASSAGLTEHHRHDIGLRRIDDVERTPRSGTVGHGRPPRSSTNGTGSSSTTNNSSRPRNHNSLPTHGGLVAQYENNNHCPSPEGTVCCSSSTENSSHKPMGYTRSTTVQNNSHSLSTHNPPVVPPPTKCQAWGQKWSKRWTNFIVNQMHRPILYVMHKMAVTCARNPFRAVGGITFMTFAILIIGFCTNFYLETSEEALWTPVGSDADIHHDWLRNKAHFPSEPRKLVLLFHSEGEDVLSRNRIRQVFNATDTIMNMNSYNDVCADGQIRVRLPNGTKVTTCYISGIVRFWNYSSLIYEWTIQSEEQAIQALSEPYYPDGGLVIDGDIFGKPIRDEATNLLTNMSSFPIVIFLPDTEKAINVELDYVHSVLALNNIWQNDPDLRGFYVNAVAVSSFAEEFSRGIVEDIPLIPFVFILSSAFACLYTFRRNSVQSRCVLGLAAVFCVLQSVMVGYGLMFIVGIPFTSMTQLVPFIIFGVGLDDAFILIDTYERTDGAKEPDERISETIMECGISIFITTLTSVIAFAIGCSSSIPAISWLCWYAFPTIAFVLLYQITLFVACIVIDEKRIQQRRRDIFFCYRVRDFQEYAKSVYEYNQTVANHEDFSYKCMYWYSKKLFLGPVKVFVLVSFVAFAGLCGWSASQFEQKFHFRDVLPKGSYVVEISDNSEKYRDSTIVRPEIVFRNEDFSDPYVQDQMEQYVNEFSNMESTQHQPDTFWLRDFRTYVNENMLQQLSFNDQMDTFMSERVYYDLHRRNMAFSTNGTLIESRCYTKMEHVQMAQVKAQIDALAEQDTVSRAMPINEGKKELSFFSFAREYSQWAFYTACVPQLIRNTYVGIICVTVIAWLLMPHWTAAIIICPVVTMMYVDILGILQWAGVPINAVTFVALVMSIGLIVDYLMHILGKYFETTGRTREERVSKVLCTMGASVLAGGFSTFLGTVPLAFSTSQIFWIVFMTFISLVVVALAHALIFLPVVLSLIGTLDVVANVHEIKMEDDDDDDYDIVRKPQNNNNTTAVAFGRDDTERTERRLSM